jgi:hypothetical protein
VFVEFKAESVLGQIAVRPILVNIGEKDTYETVSRSFVPGFVLRKEFIPMRFQRLKPNNGLLTL